MVVDDGSVIEYSSARHAIGQEQQVLETTGRTCLQDLSPFIY